LLLALAEGLARELEGLEREAAFARLQEHEDELVSCLTWFIEEGWADEAIRLARTLAPYFQATRRLEDGTAWLERALALQGGDDGLRGRAYVEAGMLWFWRGDDERARQLSALAVDHRLRIGAACSAETIPSAIHASLSRLSCPAKERSATAYSAVGVWGRAR
jgi:hypothetical protein